MFAKSVEYFSVVLEKKKVKTEGSQALSKKDQEIPEPDLTKCTGVNYFKEGEDPPIKPDEEYPEWLWELIEDGDPTPEEKQYWRRQRKENIRDHNFQRAQSH